MHENILFINACARPNSRTYSLAKYFLSLCEGKVTEIDLYKEKISPLDCECLERRNLNTKSKDFLCPDFDYAKQFMSADIIVVAAPFWDLSFPSVVKIYFEAVTVSGITFEYSSKGFPVGKCRAKKLYYITTSGGYIGKNNFGFDYVKALAENFYGIKDVRFFSAEGLDIFGVDEEMIMNKAKKELKHNSI